MTTSKGGARLFAHLLSNSSITPTRSVSPAGVLSRASAPIALVEVFQGSIGETLAESTHRRFMDRALHDIAVGREAVAVAESFIEVDLPLIRFATVGRPVKLRIVDAVRRPTRRWSGGA